MSVSSFSSAAKPGVCLSTDRPDSPFDGQVIYETDTNRTLVYDNSAWVVIADPAVLSVDSTNNRVGIGTTTPTVALQVDSGSTDQFPAPQIYVSPSGHASSDRAAIQLDDIQLLTDIAGDGTEDFSIYSNNAAAHRFSIDGSGNVGINDYTPSYTLDVNGDINTTGNLRFQGTVGYTYVQTLYFTSSGTFTKASYPWLRAVRVKMVGGGGGGGGTNINKSGAAGGGGGGYAEKWITNIAGLSASETVTIGAGGAGGVGNAAGSTGGTTSAFSVSASGGTFGYGCNTERISGGSGGTGSGGDLNIKGGGGGAGSSDDWPSGTGGESMLGGGGTGQARTTSSASAGSPGGQYGGGGGGATRGGTFTVDGGDGYDGIVIVELYA